MELQKFIQKTIVEIINGVKSAGKEVGENHINPSLTGELPKNAKTYYQEIVQDVEFDVAVTVEEKKEGGVEGKISVLGYGIGGGISTDNTASTVTRIKFSVPLLYSGQR